MKLRITLILVLIALFSLTASASGYVFDNEDILTPSEEEALCARLESLSLEYSMRLAVLTSKSTDGKSATAFTDDFFDSIFGSEDGIILFVSDDERVWALSTAGAAIDVFTDRRLMRMEDEFLPYLSDGDYYGAFVSFSDECETFLSEKVNDDEDIDLVSTAFVSIVFGLIVSLITVSVMKAKLKSVRRRSGAGEYMEGGIRLTRSEDRFLWRNVSRVRRQSSSSSSTTHRSSSGRVHGGRSGRF